MSDREPVEWSHFEGKEGCVYRLEAAEAAQQVTLEEATLLQGTGRPGGSFRLTFRGADGTIVPQQICRISAGDFAADIFLVPISHGDRGTLYEAIFN